MVNREGINKEGTTILDGHLELKDINPDNYRLLVDKPDPDFSYQKNYATIKKFLADNDKLQDPNYIDPEVEKNAGNIADILASFAKYKLDIGKGKKLEEWLGKYELTKIYGEKLIEKIKVMDSVQRLNQARGNTLYGGQFYLK